MFSSIEEFTRISANAVDIVAIDKTRPLILFGAGFHGLMAQEYLLAEGYQVAAFCDNDVQKHGKCFGSTKCISPSDINAVKDAFVLITLQHYVPDVLRQLDNMNIPHEIFNRFILANNAEKISKVYDYLYDDASRQVFLTLLDANLSGNREEIPNIFERCQYFVLPQFCDFDPKETFIDCGAFVGDTIEQYVNLKHGVFDKIIAFEPGERQYKALQKRCERLTREWALEDSQIKCVMAGLSDTDCRANTLSLSAHLIGTTVEQSDTGKVECFALDSYLKGSSINLSRIFIKADIEGHEMKLLKGAEDTIKQCKPKLAISIYHKPQDYYEVPLLIKKLVPNYQFSIRHHSIKLEDTILYCSMP